MIMPLILVKYKIRDQTANNVCCCLSGASVIYLGNISSLFKGKDQYWKRPNFKKWN